MRRGVLLSLGWVLSFAVASCAHDEPLPQADVLPPEASAIPESGRFVLTGIRRPIVATISETGIQGPDANLGRTKNPDGTIGWRGTAFNQPVNLTVKADGAEGVVAKGPFNVHVTPDPGGMVASGLVRGVPSTVTISKTRINGGLGPCGYDLTFQGQAYVGPRSCGSAGLIQVGLTLPTILASWNDAEVATVLELMLSAR